MLEFGRNLPAFERKILSPQTLKTETVGLFEILEYMTLNFRKQQPWYSNLAFESFCQVSSPRHVLARFISDTRRRLSRV